MKVYKGKKNIEEKFPDLLFDESRFTSGVPKKLFFPRTQADVVEIIKEASSSSALLGVIGAQTGITGGGVPIDGCFAVCFSHMNAIERVDWTDPAKPVLYCQPGATLADIARFLEAPGEWPVAVEGADSLAAGEWLYPPDPTEMTAQLGGTAATNASGARSYFFGPTRAFVAAIEMVLADGDAAVIKRGDSLEQNGILTFTTAQGRRHAFKSPAYESPAIKNASGYYAKTGMDVIDLFIGSEGTLALFTSIGIRLVKAPRFIGGLSFFQERQGAFGFADFLREHKGVVAIEYFDEGALHFARRAGGVDGRDLPAYPHGARCAVYWEYEETPASPFDGVLDSWEGALKRRGSSFDDTWSGFDTNEMAQLKRLRHSVPEMINAAVAAYKKDCPSLRKVSSDAALPPRHFAEVTEKCIALIEREGLEYALFGHLGDFHLHFNLLAKSDDELRRALAIYTFLMDLTIASGGTVSAEHGIGKIKTRSLAAMYGKNAMEEMARIKSELDPRWLLSRGNLFERLPQHIL
jgi:D-lactate dehydrogenase (cytochrome)